MLEHGLTQDEIYGEYKKGMNKFAVSIDGYWNLLYSDQGIKAFLYDAKRAIEKYNYSYVKSKPIPINIGYMWHYNEVDNNLNIKVITSYSYLPM